MNVSWKLFVFFVEGNNGHCENLFSFKYKQLRHENFMLYFFLKQTRHQTLLVLIFIYMLSPPLYCLFSYLMLAWYHVIFEWGFSYWHIYLYICLRENDLVMQNYFVLYLWRETNLSLKPPLFIYFYLTRARTVPHLI